MGPQRSIILNQEPPATHPHTHLQDIFFLACTYPRKLRFCLQPNVTNLRCLIHLSGPHLSSFLNFVRCPPLVYTSGMCSAPPLFLEFSAVSPPYCNTWLHLEFSAKLKIWQVPACKMEPRSGIILFVFDFEQN